jgi:serine/threonine protein kinase/tetratricopeptide (TPR) repeat protein
MKVEEWERVERILQATLERAPDEWNSFLDRACAGDARLHKEVASLLAMHMDAADFLESPAAFAADWLSDAEDAETDEPSMIGERIGAYRIKREIARGGMGAVYLAKRDDDEFKKQVAIKLVKRDFDSAELRRRFRHERQILAALDHPNIAKLLDGGTTQDGRPFLVMEYVEGASVTQYSEEHRLSIEARLELFRTVCAAVSYAHQHLVIHRDIKPSNILVTEDGTPKLLDFGIAKLLKPTTGETATETITLLGVMTPEYASPEQIKGETVTTATDLYSLGVLLYELLTGRRPFRFTSRRPDEIARIICENEPQKPSECGLRAVDCGLHSSSKSQVSSPKSDEGNSKTKDQRSKTEDQNTNRQAASGKRQSSFNPQWSAGNPQSLKGDLDNIILMAMRKEPARRYASVEQFSEDIRRHLAGLPVIARKDTFAYRASKFIGRNRVGVAAAALVLLAILAGFTATAWQARVAARGRDQARQAQAKAEQVNKFLQSILSAASPEAKGRDAKVLDVLSDAAARVDTEFANQPELKAQALLTIGKTYADLGLLSEAEKTLREALKINLELHGEANHETTQSLEFLGATLLDQARYDEAESLFNKAIATERKLSPQGNRELAFALFSLGELYVRCGEYERAKPPLQESISISDKLSGKNNEDSAFTLISLGRTQSFSGDLNAAETSFRQSVALFRNLPQRRQRMAYALLNLGYLLMEKGNYDEAIGAMREADAIFQEQNGESFNLCESKSYLCMALTNKGNYQTAVEEGRKAISIGRKVNLENTADFIWTLNYLGLALTRTGRSQEGEPVLRESLERARKTLPPDDLRIPRIESVLGECLTAQSKFAEAEPFVTQSCNALYARAGANNPFTALICKRAVDLYEKWQKPALADEYRAKLQH